MKTLVVARSGATFAARKMILAARAAGYPVDVLFFGHSDEVGAFADCGAGEILTWNGAALETHPSDAALAMLETVCAQTPRELILFAGDSAGRDWAPRLAWRLKAGLITECIGWSEANGRVAFRRPVYGGKAIATIVSDTPVTIVVVQPGTLDAPEAAAAPASAVRTLVDDVAVLPAWPQVTERVTESGTGPALTDARIVVSGGRGIGSAENFALVEELARALDAALGASRAAVDEGWVPATLQVGQTGKSVRPEVYFAVGISGASQHLAGMTAAKNVVAINTNGDAPIFGVSRFGIVGDYKEVLPPLVSRFKELLGN